MAVGKHGQMTVASRALCRIVCCNEGVCVKPFVVGTSFRQQYEPYHCPAASCHADFGLDKVLGPDLLFLGRQDAAHATSEVVNILLGGAGGTIDVYKTGQLCMLQ